MTIHLKDLGMQDYVETYEAMREFNEQRQQNTDDEIWLLEHPPVYTLGLSGKEEHLLNTNNIPVIKTDRGGQVTYHGPGQLIAYLLINLNKRPYAIRKLVSLIEKSIIDYLQSLNIGAERKSGMPGVYINEKKIAALGVRVRKGGTYHGLALNVDMDIRPFKGINPCGYKGLVCTQLVDHVDSISIDKVKTDFPKYLIKSLDIESDKLSDVA